MKLPHSLLDGVLKVRAEEYAGTLYPGATVDANDRVYLAGTAWGRLLNEALVGRGLRLDGDAVVEVDNQLQETGT